MHSQIIDARIQPLVFRVYALQASLIRLKKNHSSPKANRLQSITLDILTNKTSEEIYLQGLAFAALTHAVARAFWVAAANLYSKFQWEII